jgi:hypothetical protein
MFQMPLQTATDAAFATLYGNTPKEITIRAAFSNFPHPDLAASFEVFKEFGSLFLFISLTYVFDSLDRFVRLTFLFGSYRFSIAETSDTYIVSHFYISFILALFSKSPFRDLAASFSEFKIARELVPFISLMHLFSSCCGFRSLNVTVVFFLESK